MIDHRQEGSRKDSDRSERTRFGGFFVARVMRIKRRSVIFKRGGWPVDNVRLRRAGRGS